jgi:hypothetical protein
MAIPKNTVLKSAYDKLQTALTALLLPSWAKLIIEAGLLLIDYLSARDELTM